MIRDQQQDNKDPQTGALINFKIHTMKKMLTYFLFWPLMSISQTKEVLFNHLNLELKSRDIYLNYNQGESGFKKIKINFKRPNLHNTSFSFLNDKIEKLIKNAISDCSKEGTLDVDIEVKTITKNFISILSKMEFDCKSAPSEFYITKTLNYLKVDNQLFLIKINPEISKEAEIKSNINKELNDDCQEEFKNSVFSGKIAFYQGKGLIVSPVYTHFCYVEVLVPLKNSYILFEKIK